MPPFPRPAADKLVGLTRRAGTELAGLREERDTTLVRHIHDLHATRAQYDPADVAKLARKIMIEEATKRAEDFPAYKADPQAETLEGVRGHRSQHRLQADYATFRRDMVYGGDVDFETAVQDAKGVGRPIAPSGVDFTQFGVFSTQNEPNISQHKRRAADLLTNSRPRFLVEKTPNWVKSTPLGAIALLAP